MSRRSKAERKLAEPDSIYNSRLVTLLISRILQSGKKSLAQKIVYNALETVGVKTEENPILVLEKAVKNVTPKLEVKARRVGGSTYQVPIEVPNRRQFYLAAHWIIDSAKKKSGSPMSSRLAGELLSASNNEGNAIKKKEDTHRMAEANKAFAHFGRGR